MKWQAMGLSPSDMGIIDNNNAAARNICLAWGVPPQLLGIPGDNTYANYKEARLAFWEDTIIPLVGKLGGFMSRRFTEGEIELRPKLDKIPAIVDQRGSLWKMVEENDNLTVNEKREAMGYEPVQGGDVLLVPMSQIPLSEAGMSAARGDEPTDLEEAKALALSAGYGDLYK
jgi:phage portal protein BeeE